jgi:epoxyqueuosine reductase
MAYLHRTADRRADVRHVLPSAQTVIVTATVYNTDRPYSTESADSARAQIARYAWGDDYHEVIGARLESLLVWMRDASPAPFDARAYVDTGPVQERVYAQHAGVGWIGKNTCVINPELGSWVFLGVIICSLPLASDAPSLDQCGTCTLCLEACPTHALVAPGVLDSTRCISYLTIELRGAIPEDHRAGVGSHVYGCDICQEVCPWNRKIAPAEDPAFITDPRLEHETLADVVRLDDAAFADRFAGTAVARARRQGMVRNAIIVAANTGDEPAIDAAGGALEDADPIVRSTAAGALVRAGGAANRRRVERALAAERDTEVAADIEAALDGRRFDGPRDPVL